jgi:hypothetical protein
MSTPESSISLSSKSTSRPQYYNLWRRPNDWRCWSPTKTTNMNSRTCSASSPTSALISKSMSCSTTRWCSERFTVRRTSWVTRRWTRSSPGSPTADGTSSPRDATSWTTSRAYSWSRRERLSLNKSKSSLRNGSLARRRSSWSIKDSANLTSNYYRCRPEGN